MKKILFSALALVLIVGAGCKKDKDEETCTLSSASLVGSYKLTAATAISGSLEVPILNTYDSCRIDDITSLNADSTFLYQDQGSVCTPSGSYSGRWTLSGNNLFVIVSGDTTFNKTVVGFDCSNLVVTSIVTGVTRKETYTRQ